MISRLTETLDLRGKAGTIIGDVMSQSASSTERSIADEILVYMADLPDVLPSGWYDPPAQGIAVLFASENDDFVRTRFSTLRSQAYAPSTRQNEPDSVGIIYVSPVNKSGLIGDWGATFYTGKDEAVRRHVVNCLDVVEKVAEFPRPGIQFGDVSRYAGELLAEQGLTTGRTQLTNSDATGINCGHTIPWSDGEPTEAERAVLQSGDQPAINALISIERVFINDSETTSIPDTISFTAELRLESLDDPRLPNVFFHLIVSFDQGEKTITSNYNPFFSAKGMDYINASY